MGFPGPSSQSCWAGEQGFKPRPTWLESVHSIYFLLCWAFGHSIDSITYTCTASDLLGLLFVFLRRKSKLYISTRLLGQSKWEKEEDIGWQSGVHDLPTICLLLFICFQWLPIFLFVLNKSQIVSILVIQILLLIPSQWKASERWVCSYWYWSYICVHLFTHCFL